MNGLAAAPAVASDSSTCEPVAAAFCAATQGQRPVTRDVRIAGHLMRLEFAGRDLAEAVMPAFAHLVVPPRPGRAELTVQLWSSPDGDPDTRPPVLESTAALPPGAFLHRRNAGVHVSYQPARRILNVFDGPAGRAWFWVADGKLPYWERSAPLRHVIHWWLQAFGIQQLHSSAVGTDRGAALVVGRSGSGKSTTALACVRDGLSYLGDDYVLVSSPPRPQVFSTFCSGKLVGEQLVRFPELTHAVRNADFLDTEKSLVYLTDLPTVSVATTLPLAAVVVPVVTGRPGTLAEPLRRAAAIAALAPSTLVEVFTAGNVGLQRMRAIVDAVPCYTLHVGNDLESIGPAVRRLLEDATRSRQ